ncbi:hypothetical protein RDABS01_007668 [Bienertia sinuspersici]
MEEDELYKPEEDVDVEDERDDSDEELSVGENSSNPSSKSLVRKFGNLKKRMPKTKALAVAFKKQQQKLHILTRGKHIEVAEYEQGNSTASALLCTNETNKENDDNKKPTRGPTMCYKIHGRSEEERLEIILNEHGQPIGLDNNTLNEFSSILGTIARKANLLPLTVKNWPIFKNDKREELWDYVKKHYVVPIEGKKWVLQTIGACWRCYKCSLKRRHFLQFENDAMRMKKRPKNVLKTMFKELLKIWHSEEHKKISAKNTMNPLVGKKKNIMPTTGPKSFARVREEWCELKASSSLSTLTSGTENAVAAIFNSKDKKKCQFPLYGRGVSGTLLKQKAMLEEAKKKNEEKMESLKKDYEDKRRQDKMELASSL